jgi:hypothetical protein
MKSKLSKSLLLPLHSHSQLSHNQISNNNNSNNNHQTTITTITQEIKAAIITQVVTPAVMVVMMMTPVFCEYLALSPNREVRTIKV